MTDSEKWAWWTLGVVALTAIVFFAVSATILRGPARQAAFAILALTAVPANSRRSLKGRRHFDEREKEIAGKAVLAGFRVVWLAFIGLVMTIWFVKGWDATLSVPVWVLISVICWATMIVLAAESVTTLVLYRRG
jgi:hypothetical protein